MYSTVLNIDNNHKNNVSWTANQHIRMISEGSYNTEDWWPIIWLKEGILGIQTESDFALKNASLRQWNGGEMQGLEMFFESWTYFNSTAVFENAMSSGRHECNCQTHLVHVYITPLRRQRKWAAYFLEQTLRLLMP